MELQDGKTYVVNSRRKGRFSMRLNRHDGEWATGTIVGGKAEAMIDYNEREVGEEVTVRISFCTFTEVTTATDDRAAP